jgi:hypothetical protein
MEGAGTQSHSQLYTRLQGNLYSAGCQGVPTFYGFHTFKFLMRCNNNNNNDNNNPSDVQWVRRKFLNKKDYMN